MITSDQILDGVIKIIKYYIVEQFSILLTRENHYSNQFARRILYILNIRKCSKSVDTAKVVYN